VCPIGRELLLEVLGKGVEATQIAVAEFKEGTADEVLVHLVEHLGGELAEVILEIAIYQDRQLMYVYQTMETKK
jgi:hypothetical protein